MEIFQARKECPAEECVPPNKREERCIGLEFVSWPGVLGINRIPPVSLTLLMRNKGYSSQQPGTLKDSKTNISTLVSIAARTKGLRAVRGHTSHHSCPRIRIRFR